MRVRARSPARHDLDLVIDLGRDPSTGRRQQRTKGGFRVKRDAERAMAEMLQTLDEGTYVARDPQMLGEWCHLSSWAVPTWSRRVRSGGAACRWCAPGVGVCRSVVVFALVGLTGREDFDCVRTAHAAPTEPVAIDGGSSPSLPWPDLSRSARRRRASRISAPERSLFVSSGCSRAGGDTVRRVGVALGSGSGVTDPKCRCSGLWPATLDGRVVPGCPPGPAICGSRRLGVGGRRRR